LPQQLARRGRLPTADRLPSPVYLGPVQGLPSPRVL
jgi:hypothetical protein